MTTPAFISSFAWITLFFCSCNHRQEGKDAVVITEPGQQADSSGYLINEHPRVNEDSAMIPVASILYPGTHDFTLHWIGWDRPGKVHIQPADSGWYRVTGEQRDRQGNFITIDGELKVIDPLELKFRGTIREKVQTLNQGDTCTREGEQVFLSTRNRKYWRLQNMANCEGSGVVDYIDIYF